MFCKNLQGWRLYSLAIRFSFPHSACCPIMRHVLCGNWKILSLVSIVFAHMFYIMLLTTLVSFYFSAILHAKRDFDMGIEIFVIFSALQKNNPPFPHSYPHIHYCHLYLSKASKLQKLDVITPFLPSCKHIFGLHNFHAI